MKDQEFNLILCRHGETKWTLSGQHTSFTDLSLTSNGKKQAHLLGKRLEKIEVLSVYSSPLLRAVETCSLAGFSKKVILEPDAVEWNYGAYEGKTTEEIDKKHPGWNIFSDGAPGGESPVEATQRADRLIAKLSKQKGTLLLFSHGHFSRLLAARWIDLESSGGRLLSLSVASISILGFEKKQRVLKLWNSQ